MSYILDALRKSEAERAAGAPNLTPVTADAPGTSLPRGALIATAVVAVLLGVGATVAWRLATAPRVSDVNITATPVSEPESQLAPPTPAAPTSAAAPERSEHGPSLNEQLAAPPPRARPIVAVEAAPAAPSPVAMSRETPWLRQMSDAFRQSLPPLAINIHVYSPAPDQCILYINNHAYRAGDAIAPGLRVERIVEDGAILRYQGQDFKLPRPN